MRTSLKIYPFARQQTRFTHYASPYYSLSHIKAFFSQYLYSISNNNNNQCKSDGMHAHRQCVSVQNTPLSTPFSRVNSKTKADLLKCFMCISEIK